MWLKTFGLALLLASGLAIAGAPVRALQIVVTQVDKNSDGSMTYHFAVKTDQGETLMPGESKETSDFVTVYNFNILGILMKRSLTQIKSEHAYVSARPCRGNRPRRPDQGADRCQRSRAASLRAEATCRPRTQG